MWGYNSMTDKDLKFSSEEVSSMEQQLGQLEGRVEGIEKTVDNIDTAVNGNGRDGLKQTMVRLEEKVGALGTSTKDRGDKLDELISTNTEMVVLLNEHIGSDSKHTLTGLLRSMPVKFFFGIIVMFIIGHAVLTAIIPNDISVWELIGKLVF